MKSKSSYINDSVHGHIYLTDIEMAAIDTLEFQRLRFIRQNSLLHFVFPGAFHTRFAHSIGTCHIGGQISRQLFNWVNEPEAYYPVQVYRLACLLHDIGHGAFSHSLSHINIKGESFLPSLDEVLENAESWGLNKEGDDFVYVFLKDHFSDSSEPIQHEEFSILIIKRLFKYLETSGKIPSFWQDISSDVWIQDIASMIHNEIDPTDFYIKEACELIMASEIDWIYMDSQPIDQGLVGVSLKNTMSSLVSGTVDADRMDYLLRDSAGCGVNYGLYDQQGLISAMSLVVRGGEILLGINGKRISTLDDFLWSRYQMFKQVYCHKTHAAYNLLLEKAIEDLVNQGNLSQPKSLDEYCLLTDDMVMSMVFGQTILSPAKNDWIGAFSKRQLPKFVGTIEDAVNSPIWTNHPLELIKDRFSDLGVLESESGLAWISHKAQIIKESEESLPAVFEFQKTDKRFKSHSYLSRSVFFQGHSSETNRLESLKEKLNQKLLFVYVFSND